MATVIRFHKTGDSSVLQTNTLEIPAPGPGDVKISVAAAGLNFIDTYHRSGLYPVPNLPSPIGLEGAGTIIDIGESVSHLSVGDRVAYCMAGLGSYASERLAPANRVVKIPDAISLEDAAGLMLKGQTAEYLLHRTFAIQPGQTILFHAIAGGVGQIACQWAKALGATVIGTVGSEDKASIAQKLGCDHVINSRSENIPERVKEITKGKGVPVVYDGVGKDTFEASLACLAPRGLMVTFGNASGKTDPLDLIRLSEHGSLYVTRPTLMSYCADDAENQESARKLFQAVQAGIIRVCINQTYPLSQAGKAHNDLENRKTTGSTLLIPE